MTTDHDLLEALKTATQILEGHQKLIESLCSVQGYHQAIFDAQLQGGTLDASTRASIEQARAATDEIAELRRLFSLSADQQPGANG